MLLHAVEHEQHVDQASAKHAYRLLDAWTKVPGTTSQNAPEPAFSGDIVFNVGTCDDTVLLQWITEARARAEECDRLGVCDSQIGQVLAYAPSDADGVWPNQAVRTVLEKVLNEDVRRGMIIGIACKP